MRLKIWSKLQNHSILGNQTKATQNKQTNNQKKKNNQTKKKKQQNRQKKKNKTCTQDHRI